eukprot:gene2992-1974_t
MSAHTITTIKSRNWVHKHNTEIQANTAKHKYPKTTSPENNNPQLLTILCKFNENPALFLNNLKQHNNTTNETHKITFEIKEQ